MDLGWRKAGALAISAGVLLAIGSSAAPPSASARGPVDTIADNFRLTDERLDSHELYRLSDAKAVVLVTQANDCPQGATLAADIRRLRTAYAARGVEFFFLNVAPNDSWEAIRREAVTRKFDAPVLLDRNQLVMRQLGATRTSEAFVIDPRNWRVVYRGPPGVAAPGAAGVGVAAALDALVAGKTPEMRSAASEGCPVPVIQRRRNLTYVRDVSPILAKKCVECHQPGGIGPMPLTSYEMVKGFSPMIREVIRTQRMPPYHADPAVGRFHADKRLSPDQIRTLVQWVDDGAVRGVGADPGTRFRAVAVDWPLGKPDLVLDIPAFTIPASGTVDYQRPAVRNPLSEGRWLRASTIRVEQRQGVHHILTGYMSDPPADGKSSELRWGSSVGFYAVGSESEVAPPGVGTWLPPRGAVGFQNHYTPWGKPAEDRSKLALYFYKLGETPRYVMHGASILDTTIEIAPGAERHHETAYLTFPRAALLYSAFPHAHNRGRSVQLSVRTADGHETLVLALAKYDFNWQRAYEFAEPIRIPAGAKLVARYVYDNSRRNPGNPDPTRTVYSGEQTSDEMLFTLLRYRWVDETSRSRQPFDQLLMESRVVGMFDENLDDRIQPGELKTALGRQIKAAFPLIDANRDGTLDSAEIKRAMALMPKPSSALPPAA